MADYMDAEPQEASADSGAMSDDDLASLLAAHETQAVGYYTSEIADEQAQSLDYYYGRPFGDEQAGRSQVVDRTVQIVVDNAVAALLKPFVSDDAVAFEPRGPEDEESAKQATEYVNYVFSVDNGGILLLHNWFKSALLEKLGIVKTWWEDSEETRVERLEGLDGAQVEMVMGGGDDYEVIGGPYQDEGGMFAIDVSRKIKDGCVKIITVPSEEFLISPYSRDIESAEYVAHKPSNMTRSDLIDMGLDKDVVDGLPAASADTEFESRSQSRWEDESFTSGRSGQGVGNDTARDRIAVLDEYVLVDFDGDGIAERRRIIRVDNEILFNEEVDDNPFALLCPVPMPHKVYGQSLADQTRDLQRISSVLWRQTLDNIYLSNNLKIEVPVAAATADGATYDDLMDPAPGGIIRTQQGGLLNPIVVEFVADKSFPMLEYIDQQQEARTGISRAGQGLDPNALRGSGQMTATQVAQITEGKNARTELIARIFAETGVKRLFRLILRMLIKYQPRARMIRLRNQWVEIDPRGWNADMDLAVTVGLGVGSKAEQIGRADSVLETMAMVAQSPFAQMIGPEQAYHAVGRKLAATGIKDVENYLVDPKNAGPQPEKPDPEMAKVMAEQQQAQAKMEFEQQMGAMKLQMQQQEGALKIQLAREQAEAEAQLARDKAQFEAQLAEQRMAQELELAERRMAMEESLTERKASIAEKQALSKNRPGGDLDK
jgi:hypothetical protein